MGKLQDIADRIERQHEEKIERKAQAGQLRSLELFWKTQVHEKYNIAVPDFVGRDRENLRLLWKENGPGLNTLLSNAVKHWPIMRQEKYLDRLSPTPIFREFFTFRAQIIAYFAAKEQREKASSQALKDIKKYEKEADKGPRKIDFGAMVAEARKKIQEEKK